MLPDIDSTTTASMLSLADDYPDHCHPMAGLHPTSVKDDYTEEIDKIRDLLNNRKFWGIGETGIDLYWDKTYLEQQVESFKIHISLAKEYELPLIIHCRDSFPEIAEVLDNQNIDNVTGIFHAFTGTLKEARTIISYGFRIGVGGIVTFKNSGLDQILKEIEPIHLVLETDSPYLAPAPHRGKRNESSYIILIAEKLAEIYNMPIEEIAEITTKNANELFGLEIQLDR